MPMAEYGPNLCPVIGLKVGLGCHFLHGHRIPGIPTRGPLRVIPDTYILHSFPYWSQCGQFNLLWVRCVGSLWPSTHTMSKIMLLGNWWAELETWLIGWNLYSTLLRPIFQNCSNLFSHVLQSVHKMKSSIFFQSSSNQCHILWEYACQITSF